MKSDKWGDFEPMYALIGGVLQQAVRDAVQMNNEKLRVEAWDFLEICAPLVAERLHKLEGGGGKL